ncbi:MAG: NAD(P)H-hydrate epimerase, partial [Egibacteraceae bacterium]
RLAPVAAAPARAVAAVSATYGGALPMAGIVVDALVGGGLSGELGGLPRELVLALQHQSAPVVAVDTPSGVHPVRGLVGACVLADVTVALGALRSGLLGRGMGPFVGDLYLAGLDAQADTLVRLVPDTAVTLAAQDQPVGPDGVIRQPRGP